MFGGNFAPVGWALCNGQLLAIAEYEALFNLIGTTYGGDGETTFALPDLQGRVPVHQGPGFVLSQSAGEETVTLTVSQLPNHSHPLQASTNAASSLGTPTGATANTGTTFLYAAPGANPLDAAMNSLAPTGGNQPHENMAPFLCLNFIIALFGVYPSQT
jgi:microcystin-dependent protein